MMKKAALSLALAGLVLAGCGSSSSSTSTTAKTSNAANTSNASSSGSACPHNPVRFAVEPYDTGPALEAAYKSLASDLQAKLGCPVQLIISNSYVAEIDAMHSGQIEMGEFGPLGYILAHQIADAQPVAAFGDTGGKPDTYTAGIWVPKSSPITSLKQLKGKTLALSSTTSTSGGLYPISALIAAGFKCSPTSCNGVTIKFAGSHTASLLALTHGTTDAAEVNSQQQSSATKAHQFNAADYREIWKSTDIINDPVTVAGSLPAAFQAKVRAALLGLTAQQVSTVDTELGTNSNGPMVAATDSLYNQVRQVAQTVHLTTSDL
ncbi:MAG TPA: phosphate/phosphite/phosphonate ABC transporter substrate-binding protein [Solirubrobacteraceae bacterium]|nr:phosphate/phosphite/phosphonate ABC transporter substrate-binding protein [Solirubrobacteraceae bacterium]